MRKATISMAILLAVSGSARADDERSSVEAERVETAPINLFPLPGPIYDEKGRLIAAPPPPAVHDMRDVLLRLPVLPEAPGNAGSEPGRTAPRRRGEP